MKKIKLTKLKEVENPYHPNNIEEGYEKIGVIDKKYFAPPTIGNAFWIDSYYRTNIVTEIIDDKTFKTLNSIYKWELIKDKGIEHYGYKVNGYGYSKKLKLTISLLFVAGGDAFYPHLVQDGETANQEPNLISLKAIQTVEELIDLETKLKSII